MTFHVGGETPVPDQVVDYGQHITAPVAAAPAGYTFTGWYTDPALTTMWNFDTDTMPVGPLTLYAGYEKEPVGGSGTLTVDVDSIISFTLTDADVALLGEAGQEGVATADGTLGFTVVTNNLTGYSVAVRADQDELVGNMPGNTDTIPVDMITASAAGPRGTAAGAKQLSTVDTLLFSVPSRTEAAGDALTAAFTADLPFVNSDTYTGTVTFTATVNS